MKEIKCPICSNNKIQHTETRLKNNFLSSLGEYRKSYITSIDYYIIAFCTCGCEFTVKYKEYI